MDDHQKLALTLLGFLEDNINENAALKMILECDAEGIPDWRERVETQKALNAGKVHDRFAQFRALY